MSTTQALQQVPAYTTTAAEIENYTMPKSIESPLPTPITRDDLADMGKQAALRIATEALHRSLKTLFASKHIVELRALDVTTPEKRMLHIDSGYYDGDHRDQLIERALWLQRYAQAKGVYVTLQEIRPVLLARRANRSAPAKETTADHDVARYRWLPVDLDMHPSVRPSGISSSPEQWTQIHHTAAWLRKALFEMGWPQPVYADSGNGAHLLWRIDLAPGEASLLSRVLGAIHARAKQIDQDVEVDLKNYNPARIWKLYGTLACKGDHMSFAPHRLSRILEAPEQPVALTVEQMEDICARWGQVQTAVPKPRKTSTQHNSLLATPTAAIQNQQPSSVQTPGVWTVEGWAPKVGLELPEAQVFHSHTGPGQKWNLKPCPCDRKCPDGAAIQRAGDGVVSFRCHHNNCDLRSWDDLRTFLGDSKHARNAPPSAQPTEVVVHPESAKKPPFLPSAVSQGEHPHQPVGLWRAAVEAWIEIFRKEGPHSEATMVGFATLLQPLILEWERLAASELRPEAVLLGLPTMSSERLIVWTRRVERLFWIADFRVRQPKLRLDDDRAAMFLRAAAAGDLQVIVELDALDEPWRVALGWVVRSSKDTRSDRIEIFLRILRQTSRWFNRSTVEEICLLCASVGIDEEQIMKMLPETMCPPERNSSPERARPKANKTKTNAQALPTELIRVLDVLPNAPVKTDLVVPEPYVIRQDAIGQTIKKYHENGQIEEIFEMHIPHPLLVVNRQRDQDGCEWLTLGWSRLDEWRTLVVERAMICDRAKIVNALSSYGAPVDSTNASYVIKWLMYFEKANLKILPMLNVSNRMGWQPGGGFLLGNCWIDAEGEHAVDASDPLRKANAWAFAHTCAADHADVKAFNARRGSLSGWKDVVAKIVSLPHVLIALYASLAAPLVSLIGERTPIIDWSGPAGTGKTSTLRLAASVWGNPSEFKGHIIGGWNTTAVAIERRAGILGHLPLILNDSNKAPEGLQGKLIYELAEGIGKQRGDRTGGRQSSSCWSTIILSTGESQLLDYAKASDTGTAHRVLSLHGNVWGSNQKGEMVRQFRKGLENHYGHAGNLFVRWINAHLEESLEAWRERTQTVRATFEALITANVAADRICEDLAVILVAAELAHQALDLPWPVKLAHDMAHQILSNILENTSQSTAHEKALCSIWEWCWSNRDTFWGRRRMESPPPFGWAGRWDNHEKWEEIFIVPSVADRILKDLGYQPMSIRKEWADADFIRRGEGRNLLAAVRIDGIKLRCLALKHEAVMKVCSINNDTQSDE